MLRKMLKYDLLALGKRLLVLFLLSLGLGALTRLFMVLGSSFRFFGMLSVLTNISCLVAIVALVFVTLVACINRFITHLFKEQGYLTNSLPIRKGTLVASKVLSSLLFFALAISSVVAAFIIMYYNVEMTEAFVSIVSRFKGYAWQILLIFFLTVTMYFLLVLAAYSLGQTRNGNKTANAVVAGIFLYALYQVFSLVSLGVVYLVRPEMFDKISQEQAGSISFLLWFAAVIIVVISIIFYATINLSLNKKMDIE